MPFDGDFDKLLSETILWDVLASVADAVVTIDEEHRVIYCNRMTEVMFGYSCEELIGKDVLDPMLQGRDVVLDTDFAVKPLRVLGDPDQLKQVFLNLLQNAIETFNNGGRIRIVSRRNKARAEITIGDNGPGISPEKIEKIFDPFFTTKAEGTGLGLAITKNIVHDHGGEIEVRSEMGKGTSFLVILPLEQGSGLHT